jgi:predicted ferric reductase
MSIWEAVTWDTTRAGGFTAYILLTLSVIVGLTLSMQWQSASKWPRLINSELHNFLALLALIFTIVHVLVAWIDPYTHFGWTEVLIPLASHYQPLGMAFGIITLYLGIAIGISTWLRPYIGYKWWRRLHVFTLLMFGLVTVHGVMAGSDTKSLWALGIYFVSMIAVGGLLIMRLLIPINAKSRSHPVLATITTLLLTIGAVWMWIRY